MGDPGCLGKVCRQPVAVVQTDSEMTRAKQFPSEFRCGAAITRSGSRADWRCILDGQRSANKNWKSPSLFIVAIASAKSHRMSPTSRVSSGDKSHRKVLTG